MSTSNFQHIDFTAKASKEFIYTIDTVCETLKWNNNEEVDMSYLISKYDTNACITTKTNLFYCIMSYIVNKVHRYGLLDTKIISLNNLFDDLCLRHIAAVPEDIGFKYLFDGLTNYDTNYIYGTERIEKGVNLINLNNKGMYISTDFLYGSRLMKKFPENFLDMSINYDAAKVHKCMLQDGNIEQIVNHKLTNVTTSVYINFTTDIVYFIAFCDSLMEIIKETSFNEDIRHIGFFWNIILDKRVCNNAALMNELDAQTDVFYKHFKNRNSVIITIQKLDIDINDNALYTTFRFINMSKYMEIADGKPIIQTDVDFDRLQNMNYFINNLKSFDIGLFRVKSTPWRKICATLSYFANMKETTIFSRVFGIFLNYLYEPNKNNWFIDQLCLSLTENYLNCTLQAETNICSIYKYSSNVFHYSTLYKLRCLEKYRKRNNSVRMIADNNKKNNNTNVFIYWDKGFQNAPKVVKQCIQSWMIKNPEYSVYVLSDEDLLSDQHAVNIKYIYNFLPNYDELNKSISKQAMSDIIRLALLYKYGGIWVDATCFCVLPLKKWINQIDQTDFFAYRQPGSCLTPNDKREQRKVDTWFIYSNDSYIVEKWFLETTSCWRNPEREKDLKLYYSNGSVFYFWVHFLFNYLYETDEKFKTNFDSGTNITVKDPQFLEHIHHEHKYILDRLTKEAKDHIDHYRSPIYKLTWKFNEGKINQLNVPFKESVLCYLFDFHQMSIDNYE